MKRRRRVLCWWGIELSGPDAARATFDGDADAYDRVRPVAPAPVFDELVQLARLAPGSSVVEIGPGTGQATRLLAERGLRVVAVELGANLAARARTNLANFSDVEVVNSSFEAWDAGSARFDSVLSCNAFHWVDPDVRFAKSATMLAPGGHLVVLATPWVIPADADRFWWDVQDDYATNVSTRSFVKELAPAARVELTARIRRRVKARGGSLTTHLLAVLVVARVRR